MGREFEGARQGAGLSVAVVVSRFNQSITRQLLDGALEALSSCGVAEDGVDLVWVPGAFEIPLAASRLAKSGRYSAVVCLGAVVRGETPHFEYIAAEVARGIGQVSLDNGLPVVFGVLTTETVEQALARAGGEHGNKGFEAAITAVEMADLMARLRELQGERGHRKKERGGAPLGPRRRGRELALQALFQSDLLEDWSEATLDEFWSQQEADKGAKEFARLLFSGVAGKREDIDELIAGASEHWRIGRISRVDAGILRLATYELLYCPETPASAVINEAVEIAKRFGSSESSRFVNGVLDRIAEDAGRKEKRERRNIEGDG